MFFPYTENAGRPCWIAMGDIAWVERLDGHYAHMCVTTRGGQTIYLHDPRDADRLAALLAGLEVGEGIRADAVAG